MSKISVPINNLKIQYLWSQYSREEMVVHSFIAIIIAVGLISLTVNFFGSQNTVWDVGTEMFTTLPLLLVIWWGIARGHRHKWPYFSLVILTICNSLFFISATTLASIGILTTPFSIIDHHLVKFDHWMGFDVTVFMSWVYHHPYVEKTLSYAYASWVFQIMLTPLILALFKKSADVHRFFMSFALFYLMAVLIYYFFPTVAPAGVMHSPYFLQNQYDLVTRFNEIHQHLPVTVTGGGMIAFPSVHVTTALTVLIAFRKMKAIFYPLLILNIIMIISTMGLGYHYLSDVLMSFLVVITSTAIIHVLYKKFIKKDVF